MIDTIFRVAAMLFMIGVIYGSGQIVWWLGAAWFQPSDVVALSIQPFDVSHGDKVEKEEGKHLATRFAKEIQRIQAIMSADLSSFADADQVRIESVLPKNLNLAPDVSVKIDIEIKAFDVDVIGVLEKLYKFFDRSDRLQVAMWVNENIKLFAVLKTEDKQRSIGPWWLEKLVNEQAAVDVLAHVYALDLYKTRVRGLDELDPASFASFVTGLGGYQDYIRKHHSDPQGSYADILKGVGDLFQKIGDGGRASALVYSYLGNVRSLQNQGDAAIVAYERATALNPSDAFAAYALKHIREAKALQPVPVAAALAGATLDELVAQKLLGYNAAALPPARRDIAIAVVGTGITQELSKALGPRLIHSSSTVPGESDTEDHNGHGTSVTSLVSALAPSARIISIKSLSRTGSSADAVIAEGIKRATSEQATIILLPLGGAGPAGEIKDAVQEALSAGALVVAAAGNDGSDQVNFPARFSGVIAVGAVDGSDKIAIFSNRGPDVLYAPGVNILVLGENRGLVRRSGTSFSATVASAIAAVVWAAKPDWTAQRIRELLFSTAVDLGAIDPANPRLGNLRRIDAVAASGRAN
jgi:hypothetical protein